MVGLIAQLEHYYGELQNFLKGGARQEGWGSCPLCLEVPLHSHNQAESLWVKTKDQINKAHLVAGVWCRLSDQREPVDEAFLLQLQEVLLSQALIQMEDVNHPGVCWENNMASCSPLKINSRSRCWTEQREVKQCRTWCSSVERISLRRLEEVCVASPVLWTDLGPTAKEGCGAVEKSPKEGHKVMRKGWGSCTCSSQRGEDAVHGWISRRQYSIWEAIPRSAWDPAISTLLSIGTQSLRCLHDSSIFITTDSVGGLGLFDRDRLDCETIGHQKVQSAEKYQNFVVVAWK